MNLVKSLVILAAGLVFTSCESQRQKAMESQQQSPNIVLIVTDDLGWSDLACYGNKIHETPNIDRFANESIKFTNFYAAAPVCTPTRASIMTGKWPARLHMTVWSENARGEGGPPKDRLIPGHSIPDLPLEEFTIANALKTKGYNTIHIGKWHLGESMFYPENQGFDINIGGGSWGCPANFFYPYRGIFGKSSLRYIPGLEHSVSDTENDSYFKNREGEYLTDRLTDEALKIMNDAVQENAPFFLNLNYYAVHTPIEAPDSIVNYYKDKIIKSNDKSNPEYAAMVHVVDHNVGRVLKTIHDLGIDDNTIVLFTSDNGGYINTYNGLKVTDNSPLRSGKGSLYEGGIRIPLIIKYPEGAQTGTISNISANSNDFYPTFCEIAGIDVDTLQLDGLSLLPILQNSKAALPREYHFWHYPHYYPTTTPVSAVRYKNWKLLLYYEDSEIELYNLDDDMGEETNLVKRHPDIAKDMLQKLEEWLLETNASYPSSNPEYVSN